MATGYLRARLEQGTPLTEFGTGPFHTKTMFLPAVSFTPALNAAPLSRDDELRGSDEPFPVIPERYTPTVAVESRAYPDLLGFVLTWMLGTPATTAGTCNDLWLGTVPGGAYRHRWSAPFRQGSYPQTAWIDGGYADQSVYFRMSGAAIDTLTLTSPDTGGVRVAASGPALAFVGTANPSLSPTYESITISPFMRSHLTLPGWLANTSTHQDLTITITNPVEASPSMGVASRYPDLMERASGPVTITGSLPQRQLGSADLTALWAATAFPGTVRWYGTDEMQVGSVHPYSLGIGFSNLQYVDGGPDPLVNERRIGGTFNFKASNAGSTSAVIELVNLTSAYT